jgi:hypothetical protein
MASNPIVDTEATAPPSDLSPPLQALWWLKKGGLKTGPEWTKAHDICQSREGDRGHDLVHALVHWIEGDMANASYWYRRARARQSPTIAEEWDRVTAELIAAGR